MSETARARPLYDEMAARLAVRYTDIRLVREHRQGHLVDLKSGLTMLVTATVARRYVPEVDDLASGGVVSGSPIQMGGEGCVIDVSTGGEPERARRPAKAAPKRAPKAAS